MKATESPEAKPFYLSKTFWTNIVALLSMMIPAARDWLAANPVEAASVLASVNVILRFVTKGRVSLSNGNGSSGGMSGLRGLAPLLMVTAVAGFSMALLPSCSPGALDDYQIGGELMYRDPGSGAKGGLTFDDAGGPTLVGRVPHYDPDTGELVGWADVEVGRPEVEPAK